VKNFALVARFEDVQEVLSRDDAFQLTYKDKMEVVAGGSNLFLGMWQGHRSTHTFNMCYHSVTSARGILPETSPLVNIRATKC
jgi:hypothetical protein